MKLIFVHMLNNFSGSPNVLSVVIKGLTEKGVAAELITGVGDGFLSNLDSVKYRRTIYKWSDSKITTLFRFIIAQLQMFFIVFFDFRCGLVYYVNTVMPFGAGIACKLRCRKVIYHCHENMQQHKPFYAIYRTVYRWVNQKSIFVSQYVKSTACGCRLGVVVYNGLTDDFENYAASFIKSGVNNRRTILMVASLRRYKGVYEFVEIAKKLTEYNFELVVSATQVEVDNFILEVGASSNLTILPTQNNLHPFYQRAKLLMQLSHPESWVETFGLTILEAMIYGVPSIVPNAGGPLELVEDGKNGFVVDVHNIDEICLKIRELMTNEHLYSMVSMCAIDRSRNFSNQKMIDQIHNYIS